MGDRGLLYQPSPPVHDLYKFPWTLEWLGSPGLTSYGLVFGLEQTARVLVTVSTSMIILVSTDVGEYVQGYAPFEEIAPGLAELMYDEWKTNPATMVPYPDTPSVLTSFSDAGVPIGIVSNTGWSINEGYAATGLGAFIETFVLSCDLGIAKPTRSRS